MAEKKSVRPGLAEEERDVKLQLQLQVEREKVKKETGERPKIEEIKFS